MERRRSFVLLLALAATLGVCQSQSYYRFAKSSYEAYEGNERVPIHIYRSGDLNDDGSVTVKTSPVTAAAGSDFISLNAVVDFLAGQEQKTVDITIVNDNLDDDDETFTVDLEDPEEGEIATPSRTIVNINDGNAPSSELEREVLIAIIVACVAAVLILLVCCLLIYCLRFRSGGVREDVVYVKRPGAPEPEYRPEPYPYPEPLPEPFPRQFTPPLQRRPSYTPTSVVRPRTPPPPEPAPNTQVMVINEPSPPIIKPPPPKPTQVIVIRPQTPEIIESRPDPAGPTEVIVSRPPRPRSASPVRIVDTDDPRGSPLTVVKRITKPVPVYLDGPAPGSHHHHDDRDPHDHHDRYDRRERDRYDDRPSIFDKDRFGSRDDSYLGRPHGPGFFGSPLSAFGNPFPSSGFGPSSAFGPSSGFGGPYSTLPPQSGFGPLSGGFSPAPGGFDSFGPSPQLPPPGFFPQPRGFYGGF